MFKKRGFVWIVLVLTLIISVIASLPIEDDSSLENKYGGDSANLNFQYTYALGIGGINDNACVEKDGAQFGILNNIKEGNTLSVNYPEHGGKQEGDDNLLFGDTRVYRRNSICKFSKLPLPNEGCYFFASEYDWKSGGSIGNEFKDNCMGWVIPIGKTIDGSSSTANAKFFKDEDPSVATTASFVRVLPNSNQYVDAGELLDKTGVGPSCLLEKYPISTSSQEKAFGCFPNQKNEDVWFICDKDHLSLNGGNFFPFIQKMKVNQNGENEPTGEIELSDKSTATHGWFCEQNGGNYEWVQKALTCAESGNCDQNKEQCTIGESVLGGSSFSWLDDVNPLDNQPINCCGDDGPEDLGLIANVGQGPQATQSICINKKMAGTAGGIDALFAGEGGRAGAPEDQICSGDWCWVHASPTAKFNIITIRKPGEQPYDVVSNAKSFVMCDAQLPEVGETDPIDANKAASFLCYKEGDHYSWAQCTNEQNNDNTNGMKKRVTGEGAYAIQLTPQPEMGGASFNIISSDATPYQLFYGKDPQPLDFQGYDTLDFYVEFTPDTPTPIPKSAQIILTISGTHGTYVNENILPYVVNGVRYQPSTEEQTVKMHVKFPIQEWADVQSIAIMPSLSPEKESLIVTAMRLTTTSADNNNGNQICSGNSFSQQNVVWFDNIDNKNGDVSDGSQVCKKVGGTWEYNITTNSGICCGDDGGEDNLEYSTGTNIGVEGHDFGCWNSQTIDSLNPLLGTVQYRVASKTDTTTYDYPPQEITANVFITTMSNGKEKESQTHPDPQFSGSLRESPFLLQQINGINPLTFVRARITNIQGGNAYFYNLDESGKQTSKQTFTKEDLAANPSPYLYVLGEVDSVTPTPNPEVETPKPHTQVCRSSTCIYPLDGNAPFTITNLEPQNYDLYYVTSDESGKPPISILIDKETTVYNQNSWLEARNVKQNVLYQEEKFLPCGTIPELPENTGITLELQNICKVQSQKFYCGTDGEWHSDTWPRFIYSPDTPPDQIPELTYADEIQPETRNATSTIVPGRNLIFNARLEKSFTGKATLKPTTSGATPQPEAAQPPVENSPPQNQNNPSQDNAPANPPAQPPAEQNNAPAAQPQTVNVNIQNMAFSPSSVSIHVGDSIHWHNADDSSHTVTGSGLDHTLESNADFEHTFNSAGTINYHCTFHPEMTGTITVS